MTTLNGNLRTFLLSLPGMSAIVDTKVYEQHVPVTDVDTGMPNTPFVWFGMGGAFYVNTTDGVPGEEPFQGEFDVECVSTDIAEAIAIANIIRQDANQYRGAFGDQSVQVVLVNDQSDTYVVRNPMADLGLSISSLAVSIIP